jgi:carboxyl-terminal processing protease
MAVGGRQAPSEDRLEDALRMLRDAVVRIQEGFVEPVDPETLVDAALMGIQQHLDPHTRRLTARDVQSLRSSSGRSVGLGAEFNWEQPYPRIQRLYAGSPAQRAGLLPGDRVLAAGGVDLGELGFEEAQELMKGHLGDSLAVLALSPSGELRRTQVIFARLEETALESYRLSAGDVGYLRIRRFARGLTEELAGVLLRWERQMPSALLIDLRDCPGGFLDEGISAADLFLPVGEPIAITTSHLADESARYESIRAPHVEHVPMAILVDSLTASSGELFAGALQGAGRARLFGEPTYGKRSIQRIQSLPDGSALKVTSALFQTPADDVNGAQGEELREALHGLRLMPDHRLAAVRMPSGAEMLERLGLLQRFVDEMTCTPGKLPGSSPWRRLHPPARLNLASGDLEGRMEELLADAAGFEHWQERLAARLADWGLEAQAIAALQCPRQADCPALRRLWALDWAEERWGAASARALALESDPWLLRALDLIGRTGHIPLTVSAGI